MKKVHLIIFETSVSKHQNQVCGKVGRSAEVHGRWCPNEWLFNSSSQSPAHVEELPWRRRGAWRPPHRAEERTDRRYQRGGEANYVLNLDFYSPRDENSVSRYKSNSLESFKQYTSSKAWAVNQELAYRPNTSNKMSRQGSGSWWLYILRNWQWSSA